MSTREEILAALTEAPDGLTSKELAPLCPAAECDPIIVGSVIATLRSENVIHAAEETREANTVWIFGPTPKELVTPAGHRAPSRAPMPVTTSSPAAPADQPKDEDMTARERVLKLIEKAGDAGVKSKPIQKICGTKSKMGTLTNTLIREKLIRREGSTRSTRYFLHSAKPGPWRASPPPVVQAPRKNPDGDNLYAAALTDLQEKRAVLVAQLAKLDRAIEAVGALA